MAQTYRFIVAGTDDVELVDEVILAANWWEAFDHAQKVAESMRGDGGRLSSIERFEPETVSGRKSVRTITQTIIETGAVIRPVTKSVHGIPARVSVSGGDHVYIEGSDLASIADWFEAGAQKIREAADG